MKIGGALEQRIGEALAQLGLPGYVVMSVTGGQNNDVVTIRVVPGDAEVIFRFPRHREAIAEVACEVPVLRAVQGQLPLPVPRPIYVSLTPSEPGMVFMGYFKLPGEPLYRPLFDSVSSVDEQRRIAEHLGRFLTVLHAIPPTDFDPPLAISNDRATWERMYADVRAKLFSYMRSDARQQVSEHFESYLDDSAASSWEPALIHGDFGPSNILYDTSAKELSGVLDWSSAGLGDPATDLAALIGPASYGEGFATWLAPTYPSLAAELSRARFYLGTFALQDALFGLKVGDTTAFESGIEDYR